MAYWFIVAAILTRFIPHVPNFTPVFAALLFGGAYLRSRDSIWFPVVLLAASDFILTTIVYHMHVGWGESIDLTAFAAVAIIGRCLSSRASIARVIATAVAGPTVFFLISNFGVWLGWRMYPATWDGLLEYYIAAVPFYGNSLLSTAAFTTLLFGTYQVWRKHRLGKAVYMVEHP